MRETNVSSYGSIAPRKIVAILMTAAAALLPTSCGAAVPVASARPAVPTASLSPFAQQRALILGGGGPVGRAWEIGIIKGLADAGIDLSYMDYSGYPEYPQLYPPFTHHVSVLDLLFNVGPAAAQYLVRAGRPAVTQ